ncbi:MAG TPA: phosphoglycerate kinase [Coxiellaceae bacterium]|nr:phosphoglycerate kinase [Coxiellaceae bacterium]
MMLTLNDISLDKKRVLIREDFNVPIDNGVITSLERIERALPTIREVIQRNARVILMSHLGRPKEGQYDAEFSLRPVADALSQALNQPVLLVKNGLEGVTVEPGHVVLLENIRFQKGETDNDVALSKKMAALCDVFVMDAFATAHRAQASTYGVAEYAPIACAGPLLMEELNALSQAFHHPKKPVTAIVGGAKVSTKFELLETLLDKVDTLICGGGIANTLIAALGKPVGKSLFEPDWVPAAKKLLQTAQQKNVALPLPEDVRVATEFSKTASSTAKLLDAIETNDLILDIGPRTQALYATFIQASHTIIWNGPVGVFEFPAFEAGTRAVGEAIAHAPAFSLAGGGDTISALDKFHLYDKISYVSTGGGAFLEYLEGKTLPAVAILEKRAHDITA